MFELTEETRWIMGRPNFFTGPIAHRLVQLGHKIAPKMEDEQAYVLHWMLSLHEKHGDSWKQEAERILKAPPTGEVGQ